ncbi:MAG: AAA family ATPase [Candidatus Nanoarchaeia archaeon]
MFGWRKPQDNKARLSQLCDLPSGSIVFISLDECIGFIENADEKGNITHFLILFNSKTHKFVKQKSGKYIIQVFVKKNNEIECLNADDNLIKRILFDKEVEVFDPPRSYEEYQNIQNQIQKKLSTGYQRLTGRTLSLSEKELIQNSFGEYTPKKINKKIKVKEILSKLLNDLAFSQDILQNTLNAANLDRISQGVIPESPNLLFYGPGGTGKSELLKSLSQIYEKEFGCYIAYQNETTKQLLKGSEVEGSKGRVGAYEDTYIPILRKAIKEARIRRVPSIIPIDEGDIFVKNPDLNRDPHGENVITFLKSYAGNYDELMFIISCNLKQNELDPNATRDGRMNVLFVGPPQLKEMIKLFKNIFLNKYLTEDKLEITPQLDDRDISLICENLVRFQVTGARLKTFFIKLTSKKDIDFENIDDNFTLEDMYLKNLEKTILSKDEFFRYIQNYFGEFEDISQTTEENSSEFEDDTMNVGLMQFYNKIVSDGNSLSYSKFFQKFTRKDIILEIKKYYRQFYNFSNSNNDNEKKIAHAVIIFLNYCKENLETHNVDINSPINYSTN